MKTYTILLLLLALPLLAACGKQGGGKDGVTTIASAPPATDLIGQRFILQSVNGTAVTWENRPEIEFGAGQAGMTVFGQVCNRFTGPAFYENSILKAPNMAMTMMFCIDPALNQLESDFAALLRDGARLGLEEDALVLSGETIRLVYIRQ